MATHYETLGVGPAATTDEVRQAYLVRARALHPDRAASTGNPASARAMQDVNEAWYVLRDVRRRAEYDRHLTGVPAARPAPSGDDDDLDRPFPSRAAEPGDIGLSFVRGLPWLAMLVVLAMIFVFTAFAGGAGDGDERLRSSDLVGGCIQVQRGVGVVAAPCSGPNEGRVDLVASRASRCPSGTSAAPGPSEGTWLCLRPAGAG